VVELSWRPPTRTDDEAWLDLLTAMEAVDARGESYELADIDDEWASVWAHPETDARFVWDGADLVAFAWLKTQPGQRAHHRIAVWGGVRPSHRGRGIGRAVLDWQLRRAGAAAEDLGGGLPTSLRVDVADGQIDHLHLCQRAGFLLVRRFLEIARPVGETLEPTPVPEGIALQPWSEAHDESTRLTHVEAFADHPDAEPRSREEWRQWYTGHRQFRPDLSFVALERSTGEVVAFTLCAAYPSDWATGPREAWVNSVGTRRSWRGRGVGRAVLTRALHAVDCAADGFERAILGVDAENPTGALGLYRSLGFVDVRSSSTLGRLAVPGEPLSS
jgi:mycothiol synthase